MPAIELINTPLYLDPALIAYWRFEGNSNATIGGLNGTDYNMSYSAGQFGSCAVFNGSSSRIDLANSTIFDVQRLTISAWVYSTNFVQAGFIFEKGSVNTQYSLGIHGSPGIILTTVNSIGAVDTILRIVPAVLTNSAWNHIASTYDGQTKRIYVNGILSGSSAYTETLQTGQSGERIGAYGGASPAYWLNGKIDDLAVFSRALTPQEIYDLYNGSLDQNTKESLSKYRRNAQRLVSPNIKPASAPHNKLLQNTALFNDSSLWGYWKLDGNSLDSKASNNGTDTSITYPQENDYRGKPALFNGSTSHIQVTNYSHGTADWTYSWWVKWTKFPFTGQAQTYVENGSWPDTLLIRQNDPNTLCVYSMGALYASFWFTPVVNKWHHLALVMSGQTPVLFIDGEGWCYTSGIAFVANIAPSANMWFGASQHASTQCINAYMSDVAVFTRALSRAEVVSIYNSPTQTPIINTPLAADPNLIAYWPLNGNSNDYKGVLNGTDTAISYTGSRYGGTSGGGGYAGFGLCAFLNGTSSHIDIANSTAFDVQRLTISVWVMSTNFNQASKGWIFEKGPTNTQYNLIISGDGGFPVLYWRTFNGAGTQHDLTVRVDGLTVAYSALLPWHHIACTYDGAFKRVYIDGILCGSAAYTETLKTGQSGEIIGAYNGSPPAYYFPGWLCDLAVFSRALSATEISDYYSGNMTQMAPGGLKQYKRLENNTQAKELDSAMPASPLNIGGCKVWIDVSQLTGKNDGDAISAMTDLSGTGNNLAQRTSGQNPVYKTNILNGLPVMRHTIAASTTWDIPWAYAAPNTLFFVGKKTAATAGRGISGKTTNFLMGYWDAYENQLYSDGYIGYLGGTSPLRTTYPYVWSAILNTNSGLWTDGVATKAGPNGSVPGGLTIGYLGTSEFSDLDIGEIMDITGH